MGHRIQRPVPMPGNSWAAMNTASSRAVSGTIQHLGTLPRRSSMSTRTRRRHRSRVREPCSAGDLLPHAVKLSCSNTKENWYGTPNPPNDINRSFVPFTSICPKMRSPMRRRIAATRLARAGSSSQMRSRGVQLAMLRELTRYWMTELRLGARLDSRLNTLPQFMTRSTGSTSTSST